MELLKLPEEMVDHIVSFASPQTLLNLSRTNKYLFNITAKHICGQCLIDPKRGDKHLCDLKILKRKYFNIQIKDEKEYGILDMSKFPNIIPRNVFTFCQFPTSSKFVLENPSIENIFHSDSDFSRDSLTEYSTSVLPNKVKYEVFDCDLDDVNYTDQFPYVTRINICNSVSLDEVVMKQNIFKSNQILNLKICDNHSDVINFLLKKFSKLRRLRLHNCEIDHLNYIQSLDSLRLGRVKISKSLLKSLKDSSLSKLEIEDCEIDENCTSEDFAFMKSIQDLNIESNFLEIVAPHLGNVETLRVKEKMSYTKYDYRPPSIKHLARLKYLSFENVDFCTEPPSRFLVKSIVAPNLQFLKLKPDICEFIPCCQALHIGPFNRINIDRFKRVIENRESAIPDIFFEYRINKKFLEDLLNLNVRNTTLHIDYLYTRKIDFGYIEEFIGRFVKGMENIIIVGDRDRNISLTITKNNTKFIFNNENEITKFIFQNENDWYNFVDSYDDDDDDDDNDDESTDAGEETNRTRAAKRKISDTSKVQVNKSNKVKTDPPVISINEDIIDTVVEVNTERSTNPNSNEDPQSSNNLSSLGK